MSELIKGCLFVLMGILCAILGSKATLSFLNDKIESEMQTGITDWKGVVYKCEPIGKVSE